MNTVGLVLDVNCGGQLTVVAVSSSADTETRKKVLPGDIITQIAGKRETPWAITDASQELSGTIGKRIGLLILRRGAIVRVTVTVARLL